MFHLDVAEVDLDVAYVVVAIHACFKCFICFSRMLQVFQLYVSKVDLGEHMLQWPWWLGDSCLPQSPAIAARALSWVTVRAPEAGKRLPGAHP